MEHIGKYKGYDVYKTPKNEMEYNEDRALYAVAETGATASVMYVPAVHVKSAIKECSRLRNRMPLLTIHKFKAK